LAVLIAGVDGSTVALAKHHHHRKPTTISFGAFTAQDWPVLFQVTTDRRLITRAGSAFDLSCQSGSTPSGIGDTFKALPISATGAFSSSTNSPPIATSGGKTLTISDQLTGQLNSAGTQITGTWSEKLTIRDPSGASDTCDSGPVSFVAVD
jgi:hypothetical protein